MENLTTNLHSIFIQNLSPEESGLALGITFGIKEYVSRTLSQQMRIIGASHIMVLSGANISLLMNFLTFIFAFLPKKLRELSAILITIIFVSTIPTQASVFRATIMSVMPRIGVLLGKRTHPLYLLFLSCLSLVAIDSKVLSEISFQLSFLAVLGITLFNKEDENKNGNRVLEYFRIQLQTCISAQAFTAPLIFYYFGSISLISPLSNILLSPLVTPIMITSMLLSILSPINMYANWATSHVLKIFLFIFLVLTGKLSELKSLYITY